MSDFMFPRAGVTIKINIPVMHSTIVSSQRNEQHRNMYNETPSFL